MAADEAERGDVRDPEVGTSRVVVRPPAVMFGVPIADITMAETIDLIAELVEDGHAHQRTHQISTVNVDFLVNAMDDRSVASILQHATVCLPDGMPVVWGSRLLGMPVAERVAGADLVPLLVAESAARKWHIHIFGSTSEVAKAASDLLRTRHPDARFTIDAGPMIRDVSAVDDDVLASITAVNADILLVALGNPKQEKFIAAHRERLGVPVMIGIGGSLDMLIGKRRRAPAWMRRMGLEWVVRAVQEPRRLGGRYARDIWVFTPALVRELLANRRRRDGCGLRIGDCDQAVVDVVLDGRSIVSSDQWRRTTARLRAGASLRVHAPHAAPPCDAALAQLVGLAAVVRRGGGQVTWPALLGSAPPWLAEMKLVPSAVGLDTA